MWPAPERRQAASIGWRSIASSLPQREGNSSIRYGNASLARRVHTGRRQARRVRLKPAGKGAGSVPGDDCRSGPVLPTS